MRKLLEAFFRHKRLLLLPPLLIPVLVAPVVYYTLPVYYESVAGVWVDQPSYLNVKSNGAQYTSAAQSQSAQIGELLHTRAFMLDVAQRTPLQSILQTRGGEARVQDMFDKNLIVAPAPSGSHLITIRFRAPTGQLAQQVTQAVLDAYQDRVSSQELDQSSLAISFYQSQVQDAQDTATKATQALGQYAVAMGYASTPDDPVAAPAQDGMLSPSALDPKFAELQSNAHFAQQQLDTARAALQQAQETSAAAAQSSQVSFQVIDPPQVPTAPSTQLKNAIMYMAAALIVGVGVSTVLLVFLVAGDRSVRREADLVPPVRVLGVVPTLKLKRMPRGSGPMATRRAMGFVAGAALPAPRAASR